MPHKLILNKGAEERTQEHEDIDQAFNAAIPWIMNGYIARITDNEGVVKYTQVATNGQIATYDGDATIRSPSEPRTPWWRFW